MKMLHVTIQTNRFDEELDFYQDVVGLHIIKDMRSFGKNLIFLADKEGDTEIEIIENAEGTDAGNKFLSIGFKMDDVQKKHSELESRGLHISPVISPAPQVQFFFVKDPAGVSVQFM